MLKSLTPPIMIEHLHGGLRFATWEAARSAAQSYDDRILNAFKVARSRSRAVNAAFLRANLLHVIALSLGQADIAVTDFGGSTGDLGEAFLEAFPSATYAIVENPTLVAMMPAGDRICYMHDVPKACDVFFTSGALQYVDDPMGVLDQGFAAARRAVIMVRNSFSQEDIFRVQRSRLFDNGSGPIPEGFQDATVTYPHRTISEASTFDLAVRHGFECFAQLEEHTVLPYRGKVYGKQLVFMRRQ